MPRQTNGWDRLKLKAGTKSVLEGQTARVSVDEQSRTGDLVVNVKQDGKYTAIIYNHGTPVATGAGKTQDDAYKNASRYLANLGWDLPWLDK